MLPFYRICSRVSSRVKPAIGCNTMERVKPLYLTIMLFIQDFYLYPGTRWDWEQQHFP